MKQNNNDIGKFILVAVIASGAAYAVYAIRKARAVQHLRYQLTRIQLYQLANDGNMVFRVWMDFTNLENTPLFVDQLYLDVFLNFSGTQHRIATLNAGNIEIPANQTVSRSFDVRVPWANLGVATALVLKGLLTGNGANWPTEAKIDGQIKALGVTIPVQTTIPFSVGALTA